MRISDNMYKLVGGRLRALRLNRGLTLKDLEDLIKGMKKARSLGRYETGEDHPDYATLELICGALGADVDEVCDFVPVVRCRACEHYGTMPDDSDSKIKECPFCFYFEKETEEDGYCFRGRLNEGSR